MKTGQRCSGGFTLIELVIIIVVLGILAAIAIPKMGEMTDGSRINATKAELAVLTRDIVRQPAFVAGGKYVDVGYEGDVGVLPDNLEDLAVKPVSVVSYDKFTRRGWNGPYVDADGDKYLTDAWGSVYVFMKASRRIMSVGGSDTLAISF